jgi:hypothetical protein
MLTPTAAQEEEKMWETALNQTDDSEDDRWLLDAVAENTNGILAFVSLIIFYSSACQCLSS